MADAENKDENNGEYVEDDFLGSGYWVPFNGKGSDEGLAEGEDDERERAPVKSGEDPPYDLTTNSSMVCIETRYMANGKKMIGFGTGFLIDDPKFPIVPDGSGGSRKRLQQSRFILTAAHCVWRSGKVKDKISIYVPNPETYDKNQPPMIQGKYAAQHGSFHRINIDVVEGDNVEGANVFVHSIYKEYGRFVDIALIVLDEPIQSVMCDIAPIAHDVTVNRIGVTGYPGDRDKRFVLYMSNSHTDAMVPNNPPRQVEKLKTFELNGEVFGRVTYTNQTTSGQSGGRVTMVLEGEEEEKVYAVHNFGSLTKLGLNGGALITQAIYDWIRNCQNRYYEEKDAVEENED